MGRINWREMMGWSEEQLEDIRMTAYAYIRQGKYDIALPIFEGLVVLDSKSSYDAQTLGALYTELGQPEKALKTLEKALALEADHTPTLLNLCKTLFMLERKQEGLKLAKMLSKEKDSTISNVAKALLLAYS